MFYGYLDMYHKKQSNRVMFIAFLNLELIDKAPRGGGGDFKSSMARMSVSKGEGHGSFFGLK